MSIFLSGYNNALNKLRDIGEISNEEKSTNFENLFIDKSAFEGTSKNSDKYNSIIAYASEKYSLPFDLIKKVINAESSFNPSAVSPSGAKGLMQLMPSTSRELGVDDPFDPFQNIMGGSKYLKSMLNRFGDIKLAIAAYNAGPGSVMKYNGVPPFKETQNYIKKILGE